MTFVQRDYKHFKVNTAISNSKLEFKENMVTDQDLQQLRKRLKQLETSAVLAITAGVIPN
jgi:fructose-1-phosphate kinase PfkB-like protein